MIRTSRFCFKCLLSNLRRGYRNRVSLESPIKWENWDFLVFANVFFFFFFFSLVLHFFYCSDFLYASRTFLNINIFSSQSFFSQCQQPQFACNLRNLRSKASNFHSGKMRVEVKFTDFSSLTGPQSNLKSIIFFYTSVISPENRTELRNKQRENRSTEPKVHDRVAMLSYHEYSAHRQHPPRLTFHLWFSPKLPNAGKFFNTHRKTLLSFFSSFSLPMSIATLDKNCLKLTNLRNYEPAIPPFCGYYTNFDSTTDALAYERWAGCTLTITSRSN